MKNYLKKMGNILPPPRKNFATLSVLVCMLLIETNKTIAQSACSTSPPCPGAPNKTIYSYYDAGTNTNYWQEATAIFSSGEKLTVHAPFSPLNSLTTSSMFYNDFNMRCDGNILGVSTK